MIIAGADPGLSGALAFIDAEARRFIGIVDMPTSKPAKGRRELLLRDLVVEIVGTLDGRRVGHIYVERQQAFGGNHNKRRMGASSAFALGESYMAVKMLAAASGWPIDIVSPATWKRAFGLGADKEAARSRASELLPQDAGLWTVRRGYCTKAQAIARAEAALIALYGVRALGNDGLTPRPAPRPLDLLERVG